MNETTKAITITRHLPVKLDQYRKNVLTDKAALSNDLAISLGQKLVNMKKSFEAEIKKVEQERHVALATLHQGLEMQEISCEQRIEDDHMVTYRLDTNEKIEERALTTDELTAARKRAVKA